MSNQTSSELKRVSSNIAAKPAEKQAPASSVRVLARGLSILRAFTPKNSWLSNHQIATLSELPRPTVSRLLASLTAQGYLEYSLERGQYRLAAPVLTLGYAAVTRADLVELTKPLMQQFADSEDILVVLACRDGASMVCSEVCYGSNMLTLRVGVGSRLSLPKSAVGRALIGSLPNERRSQLLDEIKAQFTNEWPALQLAFQDACTQIAKQNFYISVGTLEQGVNGLGVVLNISSAPYTYVLGLAAPAFRLEPRYMAERLGPQFMLLKQNIENILNNINLQSGSYA
ncbi:MAG: IclR family transcriptional regulator [Alcaligenaceae bacterium]